MELFNESLKIYLFHNWMNLCFWTILLNEWFIYFSPSKKKMHAQEIEHLILQQLSDFWP